MKKGIRLFTVSLFFAICLVAVTMSGCRPSDRGRNSPNQSDDQAKGVLAQRERIISDLGKKVILRSDTLLDLKPETVTAHRCTRSAGGIHDYYSEGDYWWPDSLHPEGPYIRKDGLKNPANFTFHRDAVGRLSWIVGSLASAYRVTGEAKYALAAMDHLRAWFVDTATMMSPHLLYAQAIKGVCQGRGIGIIDATSLIEVALAAGILEKSPYIKGSEMYSIISWFRQFSEWLTTHPYGTDEMKQANNHGTWWHVQSLAYARLTGNSERERVCSRFFTEKILTSQMAADGSFPLELERTRPYSYSLFNLEGAAALAWMLSSGEQNYWEFSLPDGRSIRKGIDFMLPYLEDKEKWPFRKDITRFDKQPQLNGFLLFGGLACGRADFISVWDKIENNKGKAVGQNSPVKNPLLWLSLPDPLQGKTCTNPALPGFNPDPSICRVGKDYYLVTSSFEYFPGVPVYHSRDLVNWKLIGHVLNRPSQLDLDSIECSGGIYAPTLRYHNGEFYMITTLVGQKKKPDHRNFITTARRPEGPWSEPHWIKNAEGIDPSLFFDDDGKVYYSGNSTPPNPVWEKHRNIWIQEIDIRNWELTGEKKTVLDGSEYNKKGTIDGGIPSGVNNYEASHLYKKNGWYYLLIAHGGTSQNHAVSLWRSRQVFGPYEINPCNPVLTHRDLPSDYFFTSTGHADLVSTPEGDWWMVYLAKRPVDGENHILGRETFISPVDWSGDWPVVNSGGEKGRGSVVHFRPDLKTKNFNQDESFDGFENGKLSLYWNFIRTPREEWWSLTREKGKLVIVLRPETLDQRSNTGFIGRRLVSNDFRAELSMQFKPAGDNEEAGMVIERDRDHYFSFTLGKSEGKPVLSLAMKGGARKQDSVLVTIPAETEVLFLRAEAANSRYRFLFSGDGKNWTPVIENVSGKFLGTAGAGRFTGTFTGMYGSSNGQPGKSRAAFDYFSLEPLPGGSRMPDF